MFAGEKRDDVGSQIEFQEEWDEVMRDELIELCFEQVINMSDNKRNIGITFFPTIADPILIKYTFISLGRLC